MALQLLCVKTKPKFKNRILCLPELGYLILLSFFSMSAAGKGADSSLIQINNPLLDTLSTEQHLSVFADPTLKLPAASVYRSTFAPFPSTKKLKINPGTNYWFKFSVHNPTADSIAILLWNTEASSSELQHDIRHKLIDQEEPAERLSNLKQELSAPQAVTEGTRGAGEATIACTNAPFSCTKSTL